MTIFDAMQAEIREVNTANGWYDPAEVARSFGDDIALLHSEVSEMYEAYRAWGLQDATADVAREVVCGEIKVSDKPPKPEGVGSEAADILIRLLDTCDRHGIDLSAEYERKLAHNRTRGYRHGGKAV